MDEEQIFSNALSRYRKFGYTLFFVMLALGLGGLVFWRWYAIPIAIVLGIVISYLFSNIFFYSNLTKRKGYDKSTLRFKMMDADDKRKGLR